VIHNNELKKLNVLGSNFKNGDIPLRNNFQGSLPRGSTLFNIIKENNEFYFYSDYIYSFLSNAEMKSLDYKSKVYHMENVTEIEYYGESDRKIEMDDTKKPFIIYTKLKSGKYNLNTIDYLYSEKPSPKIEKENATLPKNLDNLTKFGFYRIEKMGYIRIIRS